MSGIKIIANSKLDLRRYSNDFNILQLNDIRNKKSMDINPQMVNFTEDLRNDLKFKKKNKKLKISFFETIKLIFCSKCLQGESKIRFSLY